MIKYLIKRTITYGVLSLFLIGNNVAYAASCPTDLAQHIHDDLKQKINEITWLDVNSKPMMNSCQFVIRYYPCSENSQQQLDQRLPQTIKTVAQNCLLKSMGDHVPREGYCTLQNVNIQCE